MSIYKTFKNAYQTVKYGGLAVLTSFLVSCNSAPVAQQQTAPIQQEALEKKVETLESNRLDIKLHPFLKDHNDLKKEYNKKMEDRDKLQKSLDDHNTYIEATKPRLEAEGEILEKILEQIEKLEELKKAEEQK